jgi:glycine hydroxymethyltransferase
LFVNKNTVPGDKSALTPHGLRLGSPSLTTRGLDTKDFEQVAEFVHRAINIAKDIKKITKGTKLSDFKATLESNK